MQPLIIENIKKSFADVRALQGVSLQVEKGRIYGLIGPDGAGKTTLLRIAVTLLNPDAGTVYFLGKEAGKNMAFVRANIGYMPQRFSLYPDLTVEENLRFFGDLFDVPFQIQQQRMERLYHFSRLGPFKNRRAAALSGGMKQKLALSCMLMHEPSVMVMDEPTYGVDPVSRADLWNILKELAAEGKSILVSTAYMDEAGLCDRIGLIFKGQLLASGPPGELIKILKHPLYLISAQNVHALYQELLRHFPPEDCNLFGNGVHLADRRRLGMQRIEQILSDHNVPYEHLQPVEPDIEDTFLELIHQHEANV